MEERLLPACRSCDPGIGCTVEHEVYALQDRDEDGYFDEEREGVVYFLPRSVVRVQFPVIRAETAEPQFLKDIAAVPEWSYRQFVDEAQDKPAWREFLHRLRLLGIEVPEDQVWPKKTFSLAEPSITVDAEPDPTHGYIVAITGGRFADRDLDVALSELGMLTSADAGAKHKGADFGVKVLQSVAGLVGTVLGAPAAEVAKKPPSPDQEKELVVARARTILDEIEQVRRRRLHLVSSGSATPKDTLALMLEEIDQIEDAFIGYFTGARTVKRWTATYAFRPGPDNRRRDVFDFASACGLRTAEEPHDGTEWTPIPALFRCEQAAEFGSVSVEVHPRRGSRDERLGTERMRGEPNSDEARGFYYRVPMPAYVKATHDGLQISRLNTTIAQFGPIRSLPADTKSSDTTYTVKMHRDIGALRQVVVKSRSVDPQAAQTAADALARLISAEREADDELARLTREAAILEKRKQIRDLEAELATSPTTAEDAAE